MCGSEWHPIFQCHTEQVHEHRHFGVIINDEFSWRPHITSICKTVSNNLYLLSQLKHFVDPKHKLFYYAHIFPHLTCASTVWDGCSDTYVIKLIFFVEELQNWWCLVRLYNRHKATVPGVTPTQSKRMLNKAVLVFKAYRTLAPPYLKCLLIGSSTRVTSRFITLHKPRTDLLKLVSHFQAHPFAVLFQLK